MILARHHQLHVRVRVQDCAAVLDDCYTLYHEAAQVHDEEQAAAQMRYIRQLQGALESLTAASTAHFLLVRPPPAPLPHPSNCGSLADWP
jgi:hypothetical protein